MRAQIRLTKRNMHDEAQAGEQDECDAAVVPRDQLHHGPCRDDEDYPISGDGDPLHRAWQGDGRRR